MSQVVAIMEDFSDTTSPGAFPTNSWPFLGSLPSALQWWRPRAVAYYQRQHGLWTKLWSDLKAKVEKGTAPSCFAQQLLENKDSSIDELQAAFLAGSKS